MAEEAVDTQNVQAPAEGGAAQVPAGDDVAEVPKPVRRRRTKKAVEAAPAEASAVAPADANSPAEGEPAEPPRRRRGRPRKVAVEEQPAEAVTSEAPAAVTSEVPAPENPEAPVEEKPKRRRGRPRKEQVAATTEAAPAPEAATTVDEMTKLTQEATVASSQVGAPPATTLAEADAQNGGDGQAPAGEAPVTDSASGDAQPRRRRRNAREATQPQQQKGESKEKAQQSQAQAQGSKRNQNKRRNRRGQEAATEPTLTREELEGMLVAELRSKAAELGVDYVGVRKKDLVESIYRAAAIAEGFRPVTGVLEMQSEGYAFLRTGNYMPGENDAFVHQQIIRTYGLRPGDKISGQVAPSRTGNKYPPLHRIDTVNGLPPEALKDRPRFRDLTPIYPDQRLVMEHGKDSTTGRAIDLVAPIGKGQRGLIVSPPKAGKTTVLKRICQSIAANNPEVHLFCLLVDERPEEVTDMERSIRGEVVASTFDMPAENHTAVAELVIEHAKRLVEQGEDVVVVLDSITRLARAYNLAQPASGRILSGGVDSAALYPPKKFLGAARNIENGGSLTILASALVDTGSKMDEVIFEEFKGTGNMELKLDRDLADKRIFPAIDPVASGTRNEDLLIDPELQPFVWGIRRVLANMNNTERAATALVKGLKATNTNQEFLIRSAKKAQQSGDYFG